MLKTYECEKNEKLKLFNIITICSIIDLDGDKMERLEDKIEKLQERKKLLKIRQNEDRRIFEERRIEEEREKTRSCLNLTKRKQHV